MDDADQYVSNGKSALGVLVAQVQRDLAVADVLEAPGERHATGVEQLVGDVVRDALTVTPEADGRGPVGQRRRVLAVAVGGAVRVEDLDLPSGLVHQFGGIATVQLLGRHELQRVDPRRPRRMLVADDPGVALVLGLARNVLEQHGILEQGTAEHQRVVDLAVPCQLRDRLEVRQPTLDHQDRQHVGERAAQGLGHLDRRQPGVHRSGRLSEGLEAAVRRRRGHGATLTARAVARSCRRARDSVDAPWPTGHDRPLIDPRLNGPRAPWSAWVKSRRTAVAVAARSPDGS